MVNEVARSTRAVAIGAAGSLAEAAVVAALTAVTGPQAATVMGALAGAVTTEMSTVAARIFDDHRRRATSTVEAAAEFADQPADELVIHLLSTELSRELLHRAVQAAAHATSEAKIKALAQALADGAIATDRAVVDESLVVIDAVGQLEALHLRLLEILTRLPDDPAVEHYSQRPWPWRIEQVVDTDPHLSNAFEAVRARVTALGMVSRYPAGVIDYADDRIHLTTFGGMCMKHLLEAGSVRTK
jgi:hypothetical protein